MSVIEKSSYMYSLIFAYKIVFYLKQFILLKDTVTA